MRYVLICLLLLSASCGFLDEEIWLDDDLYEEGFGTASLSVSGHGSSGRSHRARQGRRIHAPSIRYGRPSTSTARHVYEFDPMRIAATQRSQVPVGDPPLTQTQNIERIRQLDPVLAEFVRLEREQMNLGSSDTEGRN